MPQSWKQLLATDQFIRIFCLGRMVHPAVIDIHGMVGGFHGIWIDQEHAGVNYEQIALTSACARANGLDTFVRMAMTNYSHATQCLEAGAGGLMAARVENVAQAEEFVKWCKFAPRGYRGANTGGFDAQYGGMSLTDFARESNAKSFVAIQIETLSALGQAKEIAALADVDLLFFGPADMSQELGITGQWDHPKLWEAIDQVQAACVQSGKAWATIAATPAFALRARENGCRMLSFGMDAVIYRRGVEATVKAFEPFF